MPTDPTPDPPGAEAPRPSRRQVLTERARKAGDDLVEARKRVVPLDVGWTTFERDRRRNGNLIAGAVAFRLFVYLLPLYLLVLVIAGVAFSVDPSAPADLSRQVGVSKSIAGTIADAAQRSNESLWLLVPVTLYALASAGLSAYRAIAAAHATAWDLGPVRVRRPWVAVPSFFAFTLGALAVPRLIYGWRHGVLAPVAMVISAVLYFGLWMLASRYLPRDPDATWWALVPGAALVAAGTQGLYWFNLLYLNHKVSSASEAYGALGLAATTLFWLYLVGRLVVASPMLNATLWRRHTHPGAPDEGGPQD